MKTLIALLRAVNVGGTGKLPMSELVKLCEACGFAPVRTYIASGNVVFRTRIDPAEARALLEKKLLGYAGNPIGVHLRTREEMSEVLKATPFPSAAPDRTVAIFLNEEPGADALADLSGMSDEEAALGSREIYVHYPSGMGRSKLKIPAAASGTSRNMNTVRKLAAMAEEMDAGDCRN